MQNKCPVSQRELIEILEAWKQCRESSNSSQPFFMLIQWVPIGKNGGRVVCRPVSMPITQNDKLTQ